MMEIDFEPQKQEYETQFFEKVRHWLIVTLKGTDLGVFVIS